MRFPIKILVAVIAISSMSLTQSYAEEVVPLPSKFLALAKSAPLSGSGILIENLATKQVVYQSESTTLRAPASVLKLISMTTTLTAFDSSKTFKTSLAVTDKPNKFVLTGDGDPWLTTSMASAKKFHRAYLPYLINKVRAANPHLKAIQLDYTNVYAHDVAMLKKFFGKSLKIYPRKLPSQAVAAMESKETLGEITSPPLSDIVKFTLLWSDNELANRLAYAATAQLGHPATAEGVQQTFTEVLKNLGLNPEGLSVQDGNGLSHDTKVSAQLINDLLVVIRSDTKFEPIFTGLPLAGKTGTLKNRFKKDAPNAVGLIRAKTGWINSTVSLAGYLQAGSNEYVFTVIDSGLPNKESVRQKARIAIDRLLATLAQA